MAKRGLPWIPLQKPNMAAEFAGMQYILDENMRLRRENELNRCGNYTQRFQLFRQSVVKLLYSNFMWEGITAEEADSIEWYLLNEGRVCAVQSALDIEKNVPEGIHFGRFSCELSGDNMVDFYGNPTRGKCVGMNGKEIDAPTQEDFVLGFDSTATYLQSQLTNPLISFVDDLARQIDDAYGAWRVAIDTRKCGIAFTAQNQAEEEAIKKAVDGITENNPYLIVRNALDIGSTIQFNSTNLSGISEFHTNYINAWSAVLDMLGLENSPQNKKERLVVTEAENNRNLSKYLASDRLQAREKFADTINKKFGTNIKVYNYLAKRSEENAVQRMEGNVREFPMENSKRKS